MPPIRLFLVSPAIAIRRALAQRLEAREEIVVVGEAGSSSQGLSRVPAVGPNVVLAGAHMRDPDSIEMCRQTAHLATVRVDNPLAKVVTGHRRLCSF